MGDEQEQKLVLIDFAEYTKLKKYSELYLEKSKAKEQERQVSAKNLDELGHGSNDDIKEADRLPLETFKPQDIYEEKKLQESVDKNSLLCDLVPKKHKQKAKDLLNTLHGKPGFGLGSNGEIFIRGKPLHGSKLRQLLPIILSGIRRGDLKGEEEFLNFIQENNLAQFIGSVSCSDWFYLGD
jgi:hypothetical protein